MQCAVDIVQCAVDIVRCAVNIVRCAVDIVLYYKDCLHSANHFYTLDSQRSMLSANHFYTLDSQRTMLSANHIRSNLRQIVSLTQNLSLFAYWPGCERVVWIISHVTDALWGDTPAAACSVILTWGVCV